MTSIPSVHRFPGGLAFCYGTAFGNVWCIVRPLSSAGTAWTLAISEEDIALACIGTSDEEAKPLCFASTARNRFGIACIRPILRDLQERLPKVTDWLVERRTGAYSSRKRVWHG